MFYPLRRIFRLIEHGIQDRHNKRIYTTEPKCSGNEASFASASLLDTAPAFLVLVWGYVAAAVVFLGEKGWFHLESSGAGNNLMRSLKQNMFEKQI